ncbi:hypothetical protein vseg_004306 [Gypsophila vaccaria]
METNFEIDSITIEKMKAMRRYRTFRKIANVVRTLEIFVAILLVSMSFSWSSSHFPAILSYSGVFLRRASSVLLSPHFVFVVGNVIIITLFVNASENSSECSPENADVIVKEEEEFVVTPVTEVVEVEKEEEEEEEVVEKVYRRSKSTTSVEVAEEAERRVLRRSTTVPRRKSEERMKCEEDELSDEEFNRKVEEFIEKQRRFLSEETKILVLT